MATEEAVHIAFGKATLSAQILEAYLLSLLLLEELHDASSPEDVKGRNVDVPATVTKLTGNLEQMYLDRRLTLGRLRARLDPFYAFSPDGAQRLESAIATRNYLVHHFYKINMSLWRTPEGRDAMLAVVKVSLQQIESGIGEAKQLYQACCKALGWPPQVIISQLLTDIWLAEDPA